MYFTPCMYVPRHGFLGSFGRLESLTKFRVETKDPWFLSVDLGARKGPADIPLYDDCEILVRNHISVTIMMWN